MRITKENSLIQAQLTFYYRLYDEKLPVTSPAQASGLFLEFARANNLIDGWYVIFLDKKQNFRCWYNLENFSDVPEIAADIAGFAKLIHARQVIVARLDNGKNPKVGYLDICWIASLLENCREQNISLYDYQVVTENGWCSYQDENYTE